MIQCAYCDTECEPTLEHVIPKWYQIDGGPETFNARSPINHVKGPILIKDVCAVCNNNVLGDLDGYAKGLHESYFKSVFYVGDSVNIKIDRSRLIRWLAKVCFNSARVHGSDARILRKYRRYMLGIDKTPEPIVYVYLISPTTVWMPDSQSFETCYAKWFRLTQIRADNAFYSEIVQRQVFVDSFCFSLFAVDPDEPRHLNELKTVKGNFKNAFPFSRQLTLDGKMKLKATGIHAAQTMWQHIEEYPSRYSKSQLSANTDFANLINDLIGGKKKVLGMVITREEVVSGDMTIVDRLNELVATRDVALAAMQRIFLYFVGYDDDPRELWEVTEVCAFVQQLFESCPFLIFLAWPESKLLSILMFCCCKRTLAENGLRYFDIDEIRAFIDKCFVGSNQVIQRLVIGDDISRKITDDILSFFSPNCGTDEPVPDSAFNNPNVGYIGRQ